MRRPAHPASQKITHEEAERRGLMVGHVRWYSDRDRYGFVVAKGGGPDIFLHMSVIQRREDMFLPDTPVAFQAERNIVNDVDRGLRVKRIYLLKGD
jgi:cold shock CspA family protein